MKKKLLYLLYSLLFFLPAQLMAQAGTPVTLSTSPYTENFDGLGTALPNGFGAYFSATATNLGAAASGATAFTTAATVWGDFTGKWKNFASADGLTSAATATDQSGATNRALGLRQTGSVGDPGGAIVFQIANTTGKTGFKLSFELQSLDNTSPRTTTWTVDYGLGATPTTFTPATTTGTVTTGVSTFSNNTVTVDFGSALDNQSGLVTIRITALAASTGSGNRGSAAIDNFSLTWTAASATPILTANPTTVNFGTTQTVLTTSAAQSFSLSGTNIPAAGVSLSVAAPFSISTTPTGTYGTSLSFTQAQMAAAQTVYVEFTPTSTTPASGNITITSGTASAPVALTGTGAAAVATGANHVVISEVYGGGGNTAAVYTNDYIELYNPTNAAVDISAWSVQYASAAGPTATAPATPMWAVQPLTGSIKSHGFYLIQLAAGTTVTNKPLPVTADVIAGATPINLSASAGKVALVNNTTALTATNPTDASIVDLLGFFTTGGATVTNGFETAYAVAPATTVIPANTFSFERKANASSTQATLAAGGADELAGNGYDTNNNSTDFVVQTAPNPQSSASPLEPVAATGPTLTPSATTLTFSQAVSTTSAAQTFTLSGSNLTAPAALTTTAPYSISSDGINYGFTANFTAAQLATAQTVYVKFAAPATAGAANGSIGIVSGTATQTITLNGTATSAAAPTLTVLPATPLTFSQSVGIPSAAQSFTVSGTNIPSTGVTVTVAAPYAISTSATGTYGTTLSFTQTQMAATQTVYVQFTPTVVGAANGTVTVAATGATSQTVTLNGTGTAAVNTSPTLNAISDVTICYTATPQTVALSGITPGAETSQSVILSVSSTNPALFSQLGLYPIAGGTTGQLSYTIAPNASGTAVVTVTVKDNGGNANGGVDTYTRNFNITVNSLPNVNIVSNVGTNITKGVTAQLTATAGGTTYAWTSSLGTTAGDIIGASNTAVLTVRPKTSATYTVTVTNATGCQTIQTIGLNVSTLYPLVTNNIITPNGDGKNDTWIIKNIDYYPASTVKVIDKAGKVVFTATNYLNDWDGTYNGQPLTQGTYYYVIDLGSGAPKYTGYVTIIRD